MVGGKDHTTHHLVYAGLNDRQVWYVFLAISAISFVLSTFMFFAKSYNAYYPFIIGPLFTLGTFITLFTVTQKFKPPKKEEGRTEETAQEEQESQG